MSHIVPLYPQSSLWLEQGVVKTVDIETGFDDDDFISVALAGYPLASIDEANSYIDFTSEPDGNFTVGPTDSVAFSESLDTLTAGDTELRFTRGLLSTIDKSAVTGVRFRLEAIDIEDAHSAAILALTPSLYWDLGANGVNDLTVNNRDGTLIGGITTGTESFPPDGGTATLFDNSNDKITSTYDPYVNGTSRTFAGWAYRTAVNGDVLISSTGTNGPMLRINTGSDVVAWYSDESTGGHSFGSVWPGNNLWTHWALTFNETSNAAELFINGASVGTVTEADAYNATSTNFQVGERSAGADRFGGNMAHVAVFERILTADEIEELYNAPSVDFIVLAIRLLHKDWVYGPLDTDTLNESLVFPVSRDADPTPTYEAPFTTFPRVFRSDITPGSSDPMPIDSKISLRFNPGVATGDNSVSVYLREVAIDYNTQLDLDGTTMEDLDADLGQPDFGLAKYITRNQIDIDSVEDSIPGEPVDPGATVGYGLTQADLNGSPQFDLERMADALSAAWIEVRSYWDASEFTVEIWDAESSDPFYQFVLAAGLVDNQEYTLFIDLVEHTFRARLFTVEGNQVDDLRLDTGEITDREVFKRRKGRIGWSAALEDGDAYVNDIEPRYLNFAEYRSHPFESITPVIGTELEVGATADIDLFKGINAGPWGGEFTDNPDRGPESFRIRNTATDPLQGIETQEIYFDDFAHTIVSFQLRVSSLALEFGTMHVFLWDGTYPTSLPTGPLVGDAWNDIRVNMGPYADSVLPGFYKLVIVQTVPGIPNDWDVDKISIERRNVEWSARPYKNDPWNNLESQWTRFFSASNHSSGGILFKERANRFQVRSKALRQDAYVSHMRAKPKYAELGRLVWAEDEAPNTLPTAAFTDDITGNEVELTSTSTDTGTIISWYWTFGDGADATGPVVTHEYATTGTYPVTLMVTDDQGGRDSVTNDVVIV